MCYNAAMRNKLIGMLAAALVFAGGGCATWTFEPTLTTRFVNDYNEYTTVDYGKDKSPHVTMFTGPKGDLLPFKSSLKVRVEMPDGTRFVAYQTMSELGVLYVTTNGRWEFFEQGIGCIVAERAKDKTGYETRFEGVLCSQKVPKDTKKVLRTSGVTELNSPREHADTTNASRLSPKGN